MTIEERLWRFAAWVWIHSAAHILLASVYRYMTIPLLFLILPAFCQAQYEVSHPGSQLDLWLHGSDGGGLMAYSQPAPAPAAGRGYVQTTTTYTSRYPTHAVSWHIVGSRESRHELIEHLLTHPEHGDVRRMYTAHDLHKMSRAQLMTLHDDSHNRVVVPPQTIQRSSYSASLLTVQRGPSTQYSSSCPGGVCPPSYSGTNRSRGRASRGGSFSLFSITRN